MSALVVSNILLWVLLGALAVAVLALTRQIGVLHERLAPAGALTLAGGIKAGELAPPLQLTTLDGQRLELASFAAVGRGVLLFFVSPTCPLCKALLPVVMRIADEERGWLDLVLVSDGSTRAEHEAYVAQRRLQGIPYVVSQELGVAFQVGKLPYAALLDEGGVLVAKGLVNSREHVESLLEAKRLGVASINEFMREKTRAGR
ncbi:MAG TPA: methylamine dehydrogenase accessory protein MauD [Pseudomonadales bacterium]